MPHKNKRIRDLVQHFADGNVAAFVSMVPGVSHQTINRLFNIDSRTGKYPGVSSNIIDAITKALPAVNLQWISTGEGPMIRGATLEIGASLPAAKSEPSIDLLSQALADQAKASRQYSESHRIQAEAYKELIELMRDIRKEMARADAQAEMQISLGEMRQDVTKIVQRQELAILEIRDQFSAIKDVKNVPLKDVHRKSGRNDGKS